MLQWLFNLSKNLTILNLSANDYHIVQTKLHFWIHCLFMNWGILGWRGRGWLFHLQVCGLCLKITMTSHPRPTSKVDRTKKYLAWQPVRFDYHTVSKQKCDLYPNKIQHTDAGWSQFLAHSSAKYLAEMRSYLYISGLSSCSLILISAFPVVEYSLRNFVCFIHRVDNDAAGAGCQPPGTVQAVHFDDAATLVWNDSRTGFRSQRGYFYILCSWFSYPL